MSGQESLPQPRPLFSTQGGMCDAYCKKEKGDGAGLICLSSGRPKITWHINSVGQTVFMFLTVRKSMGSAT